MATAQLIDTHCHLYAEEFSADRGPMIRRALTSGVTRLYMPNVDLYSMDAMLELEKEYPGQCIAMMGLHPCYVKEDTEDQLEVVRDWLGVRRFAAIGEIGLDFYWDLSFREKQYHAFRTQLEWSLVYATPVVIHSRESLRECIDVVREVGQGRVRGIFHCFGGTRAEAEEIMELGMYLGIGGVVTYKKAGLDLLLGDIGISRVVLETDAPYLTPVPFRGKRNEPAYIHHVAEKIAQATHMSVEDVARVTTANALQVFEG